MTDSVENPGRYRPGQLFRHTVSESPKLIEIRPDGTLAYAKPDDSTGHAVVMPVDPCDPYSLGVSDDKHN